MKRASANQVGTVIASNRRSISTSEAVAREALEDRFGRPFSDEEWRLYRSRLVAFAQVVQEWNERS